MRVGRRSGAKVSRRTRVEVIFLGRAIANNVRCFHSEISSDLAAKPKGCPRKSLTRLTMNGKSLGKLGLVRIQNTMAIEFITQAIMILSYLKLQRMAVRSASPWSALRITRLERRLEKAVGGKCFFVN